MLPTAHDISGGALSSTARFFLAFVRRTPILGTKIWEGKMKRLLFVTFVVLFAHSAFAQSAQDNPNAELDAWRKLVADQTRQYEETKQQYYADRELWMAKMKDTEKPSSRRQTVSKIFAYVGDKLVTGTINYYANRAAIRSEMGRFDSRFGTIRTAIANAQQASAAGNADLGRQISAGNAALSSQLTADNTALSRQLGETAAAQATSNASLARRIDATNAAIIDANTAITGGTRSILNQMLPPCVIPTPFGEVKSPQPCRGF